jgi:hypothetical protein
MRKEKKKPNIAINILINIFIPVIILSKGGTFFNHNASITLIIALLFPIVYGIYGIISTGKFNFLSGLGLISILLTGGIGLLKLPNQWIIIKETSIPLIIFLLVLISTKSKYPIIKPLINEIINIEKINKSYNNKKNTNNFENKIETVSFLMAGIFLISAILNFILSTLILKSPPGTLDYNTELAKLTALSLPIIGTASMILFIAIIIYLIIDITKKTNLELEEFLR